MSCSGGRTRRFNGVKAVGDAAGTDTRIAWYRAVAGAAEAWAYSEQVLQAADAGAGGWPGDAGQWGNLQRLQQAREPNFYAEAALGQTCSPTRAYGQP